MRNITDITREEVVYLMKHIGIYRDDVIDKTKIKVLPLGNLIEHKNLKKHIRVYYEVFISDLGTNGQYGDDIAYNQDRVLFSLRDDEKVIHFPTKHIFSPSNEKIAKEKITDEVIQKSIDFLINLGFDLKIKQQ